MDFLLWESKKIVLFDLKFKLFIAHAQLTDCDVSYKAIIKLRNRGVTQHIDELINYI